MAAAQGVTYKVVDGSVATTLPGGAVHIGTTGNTSELRLNVAHVEVVTSSSTASPSFYRSVNTGSLKFFGGLGSSSSAIELFGASHASKPVRGELQAGGTIKLSWHGTGLGFFGTSPQTQPTHIADATDAASAITQLNAVIAALQTLGLLASS